MLLKLFFHVQGHDIILKLKHIEVFHCNVHNTTYAEKYINTYMKIEGVLTRSNALEFLPTNDIKGKKHIDIYVMLSF